MVRGNEEEEEKKHAGFLGTRAHAAAPPDRRHPPPCSVQRDRCNGPPGYVARARPGSAPRVLKVCHWVKAARAAERRGVAGNWVTWASTRLRTFSSFG